MAHRKRRHRSRRKPRQLTLEQKRQQYADAAKAGKPMPLIRKMIIVMK